MITCQRCQTENIEGSQYCDECGAALAAGTNSGGKRLVTEEAQVAADPQTKDEGAELLAAAESSAVAKPQTVAKPQAVSPLRTSLQGRSHSRAPEDSSPPSRRVASSAAPHAKLVIHRGRSVGKEFPMCEDESHIGRWDADGGIFPDVDLDSDDPEAKVSRRHARITRRNGQYYIEDLGSTNGTFVNRGRRLLPGDRQPLRDGDEVIVGKTFLKFHVLGS
jgi:hypothetical protein